MEDFTISDGKGGMKRVSWAEMLDYYSKDKNWGDYTMVIALSECLNIHIVMYVLPFFFFFLLTFSLFVSLTSSVTSYGLVQAIPLSQKPEQCIFLALMTFYLSIFYSYNVC